MLAKAVKRGKEEGFDVVLCDTSGRTYQTIFMDLSLALFLLFDQHAFNLISDLFQVFTLTTASWKS